jgi:hypothetical protein
MNRIHGPTGTRLRRALPAAILIALLGSVLVAAPAFAANPGVQNTGAFQLDGNAQQSVPAATPGDDWDNICATTPSTCTFQSGFSASPSSTANAVAHVSDTTISPECAGAINCTVFTGGGSKDPQDISNWKWKTDTGGLPAKDNLAHGFAARYTLPSLGPSDPNCPAPTAGPDTCKLLYFGSDRIDNSGDAQEGFWFFQNTISLNPDGSFNGVHAVGDLLILSDFSNGGSTSTINIYKWVASGGDVSANLQSLGGSTGANCNRTPPPSVPDPFCGLVNPTDGTPAPWVFTDKSGFHTYLNGELYEGGINLSHPTINLGGECFASIASETRSSTSPTATLKDFVLGGFGKCTSGTTTTPEDSSGTSISNGSISIGTGSAQAKDMAVVTGTGSNTKPTGTVKFYLCGPAGTDAAAQCAAAGTPPFSPPGNGVQIGGPVALSPGVGNSSTATSALATVTSVGHYCFRGDYSGDSLYPASSDNSLTECFTVTPVTANLTTTAGAGPVNLGSPVTDTAGLSGTANQPGSPVINPTIAGAPAGGTITFTLYGPNDCTTVAAGTGSNPQTVNVGGDATYGPVSFTPAAVGTYHWVASYSGSSPNTIGTSHNTLCDDTNEDVVVRTLPTNTVTNPVDGSGATITSTSFGSSVSDHAVVTGSTLDGSPTGTVSFFICDPGQVTGGAGSEVCASGGTAVAGNPVTATAIASSSPPATEATSGAVVVNKTGVWCFRATYSPTNPAYLGSSDATHGECFLVTDTTTTVTEQNWLPNDKATINSGGSPLDGSVTFTLYTGGTCTGTVLYPEAAQSVSGTGPISVNTHNLTVKVSAPGSTTVSWLVIYSSNNPNVSGSQSCETTTLQISN